MINGRTLMESTMAVLNFKSVAIMRAALFTLKLHRGDGMTLLAMDWKVGKPPQDFVGFAIEYKEPNGDRFYALKNRLAFSLLTVGSTPT